MDLPYVIRPCQLALLLAALPSCASAPSRLDHPASTPDLGAALDRPLPAVAPPPASGGPWSRRALVDAVLQRHPELRALAHRARARAAESTGASALPPPMAMAQLWQAPLAPPFLYGEGSMLMIGLQQTIPPAGARRAEALAATEEARVLAATLTARERDLAALVGMSMVEQREGAALLALHGSHRALLGEVRRAARARQSTMAGAMLEAVQTERAEEEASLEETDARGVEERARGELNTLLGRAPDAPLTLDDEEPGAPALSLDELRRLARERSPELLVSAAAVRRDTARAEGAESMRRTPMFTVGVNYGLMGPGSPHGHTWGATFGMSLPWLSDGASGLQRARAEDRDASRADLDAELLRLDREVVAAHARATTAARRLATVDQRLLPATRRGLEAVRTGYATGATDLGRWVEAIDAVREAEINRRRAQGDLERSLVELERAIGGPVARAPLPVAEAPGGHDGR